jgi:hypothetical protein
VPERRRRRKLGEVRRFEQLTPVGDVQQRAEHVAADAHQLIRTRHEHGVRADGDDDEDERGKQPSRAACPERPKVDPASGSPLVEEQGGDEEAAQHEEGVDAQEASRRPADAGVVQQHTEHRERPEPVERGLVRERRRPVAVVGARGKLPGLFGLFGLFGFRLGERDRRVHSRLIAPKP